MRESTILLSSDWEDYQRLFVYGATCNLPLRSGSGGRRIAQSLGVRDRERGRTPLVQVSVVGRDLTS